MNPQDSNQCPKCKTPIPEKSFRCPNCNALALTPKNKKKILLVLMLLLGGWVLFFDDPPSAAPSKKSEFSAISSGLKIESSSLFKNEMNFRIVGEITNTGKIPWSNIVIRANFYDKDNKLVDTNTDYHSGNILPNTKGPFKISFGCCHGKCDMTPYDHYELTIDNAYYGN